MTQNLENYSYLCKINNMNPHVANMNLIEVVQNVFDPEMHDSIYDMGLIYEINVIDNKINVVMTLTTINCPEAQSLPDTVKNDFLTKFPNFEVEVTVVFDPPWTLENLSDEIKLRLNLL